MNQTIEIVPKIPLESWYPNDLGGEIEDQITDTIINRLNPKFKSTFFGASLKDIPNPSLLKNIEQSVDLFFKTIQRNARILIVGDYDVDGITATALLIRFFKRINFEEYDVFIPNRFTHGYGLTDKAVEIVLEKKPDLIITVDNGINAKEEIEKIRRAGIEVIVTDHHMPQEDTMPDCAVLNPKQKDCDYPYKDLSGVGVTYLFLIAVRAEMRKNGFWDDESKEPNLLKHLDLVALGTIADQVPLLGLNHMFAKIGLEQMTRRIHENHPGDFYHYLKTFADKARLNHFDSDTVAFRLAPLLNATGRMKDAHYGVSFLLADNEQNSISRYQYIERLNQKRRKKQQTMVQKALLQANQLLDSNHGLVVFDESFHEGLIGIIANRLVDHFDLPVVVATMGEEGIIKASCRARKHNILAILECCQSHLIQFGGHNFAAGCSLETGKLADFRAQFSEECSRVIDPQGSKTVEADIEVELKMLSDKLIEQLKVLEPFGQDNRKPVFMLRNISLPVPTVLRGNHLKWAKEKDLEIIYWNGADSVSYCERYDLAFTFTRNLYRGESKRQLIIKAIRPLSD